MDSRASSTRSCPTAPPDQHCEHSTRADLTYTGSLATLLWRRVVHAHAQTTDLVQFTRLGLLTVPPALAACTTCLWLALHLEK